VGFWPWVNVKPLVAAQRRWEKVNAEVGCCIGSSRLEKDLAAGFGSVFLPDALARKSPGRSSTGSGSGFSLPSTEVGILEPGRRDAITSTRA
jgi:hypothetical protein